MSEKSKNEWKGEITFPNYYEKIANGIDKKHLKSYKNIPGWMNDAEWIYKDLFGLDSDVPLGGEHFVEIGTLLGQSSIRMAELIREWKKGEGRDKRQIRFDSIDTFYFIVHSIKNGQHPPKFLEYINLWETYDIKHILDTQIKVLELDGLVNYICCDSKYAHNIYRDNFLDFVWVDGSHAPEDVERDVKNFWPKIKPGGLIAGDDYVYEAVAKKIHLFVDSNIDEISKFDYPDIKKKNSGNYFRVYKKHTYEK